MQIADFECSISRKQKREYLKRSRSKKKCGTNKLDLKKAIGLLSRKRSLVQKDKLGLNMLEKQMRLKINRQSMKRRCQNADKLDLKRKTCVELQ